MHKSCILSSVGKLLRHCARAWMSSNCYKQLIKPSRSEASVSSTRPSQSPFIIPLEVEWGENCREHKLGRLVPVYHKTNVIGLQNFLTGKFASWASNGSCVEEIWKSFKETVFENINRFFPHKILRKNPDPEYHNKEVKQFKVKVRTVYNKRKLGQRYQVELKRLSKKLLAAKKL